MPTDIGPEQFGPPPTLPPMPAIPLGDRYLRAIPPYQVLRAPNYLESQLR